MKVIRVIIAFMFVYLFVFVLIALLLFGMWLSQYFPDSSSQAITTVQVSESKQGKSIFNISEPARGVTALQYTATRVDMAQQDQKVLAQTDSSSIFITFTRVRLSERLVPLGYFSMARLATVTDAEGKLVYTRNSSFINTLWLGILKNFITGEAETVSLVAKEMPTSYTVINTAGGIKVHEN